MVGEGSRDDSRTKKLARIFDTNHAYVSQARALLERDPPAAEAVKQRLCSLGDAYGRGVGKSRMRRFIA
jgi:hypothetical protein